MESYDAVLSFASILYDSSKLSTRFSKKKELVEENGDQRPINIVVGLYKIIAKLLNPYLLVLILGHQFAFVQERRIKEAALVANEIIDACKMSDKPSYIIKIDLEKARDRVNSSSSGKSDDYHHFVGPMGVSHGFYPQQRKLPLFGTLCPH